MKFLVGAIMALAVVLMAPCAMASFDPYHVAAGAVSASNDCGDSNVHATDAAFCGNFSKAAICDCKAKAGILGPIFCGNMDAVYKAMMTKYPSIEAACNDQSPANLRQACIDNWHCFRNGGKTAGGAQCSGSGKSCR